MLCKVHQDNLCCCWDCRSKQNKIEESKDSAVVRSLASHQSDLGSIPRLGVICWLSLLLVLILAPRGIFLSVLQFSLLLKKPPFPNSNLIWIMKALYHKPQAQKIVQALPCLFTAFLAGVVN